jgi:hypothetical protein
MDALLFARGSVFIRKKSSREVADADHCRWPIVLDSRMF